MPSVVFMPDQRDQAEGERCRSEYMTAKVYELRVGVDAGIKDELLSPDYPLGSGWVTFLYTRKLT